MQVTLRLQQRKKQVILKAREEVWCDWREHDKWRAGSHVACGMGRGLTTEGPAALGESVAGF